MNLEQILDLAAAVCLLIGALLCVAAAIGLIRFPDALSRLHAATKPQILGLIFVVIAVALDSRSWYALLALAPVLVFQALTAPISAHMVARAGYRTGNFRADLLVADDLKGAVDAASAEGQSDES